MAKRRQGLRRARPAKRSAKPSVDLKQENSALKRELAEALARHAATSDALIATAGVLKVISRSTFHLQPVLDTLVETAARLCNAEGASIATRDGDVYRVTASWALVPEWNAQVRTQRFRPGRDSVTGRVLLERGVVQIADLTADREFGLTGAATVGKTRTVIGVPLLRERETIGVLILARQRVEAFTEGQIDLVRTFADQAVIAIENTRLLSETREALEQQTATAEVLQVINSSPGHLAPVFDAMLEKATRVCGADAGVLCTYDGERFWPMAVRGFDGFPRDPISPHPEMGIGRLARGEDIVHILDSATGAVYESGNPDRRHIVELGGARTQVTAALRKDGVLRGSFTLWRREVRPFSEKQIALLQNFAEQAVIAMENARLITETREALERQTATSEVLRVISSSPGELQPVFDAILANATRTCEAQFGMLSRRDGDLSHTLAMQGVPPAYRDYLGNAPRRLGPGTAAVRAWRTKHAVQVLDGRANQPYRNREADAVALVELGGARSLVAVPLLKDGEPIGTITMYRQEVRPFTDKQVELVTSFAAQAVIAMENARLIIETREALEQQTATAEVLQVINSSPGELAPVFDEMLEKAMRLCHAAFGLLLTYDGTRFHHAAMRGMPAAYAEFMNKNPSNFGPGTGPRRVVEEKRVFQIVDLIDTDLYRSGDPDRRAIVDLAGARTILLVPLLKDNAVRGIFTIYRKEVRPFSDKEIGLLQNFAAQAVIAMENARLIIETREALEQQTATAELLGVINSSPGDLGPVFDAILEKAHRLCAVAHGSLLLHDGEKFRAVAVHGLSKAYADRLRQGFIPGPNMPTRRVLEGARFAHFDAAESEDPITRAAFDISGVRTTLIIPMRKEDTLLGTIVAARREVRPFTQKEIALLENFAAQAVIAMENARLITETREALERQTAMADVLRIISSSPGALQPVFDAMLNNATRLCEAELGNLFLCEGDGFRVVAIHGAALAYAEHRRREPVFYPRDNPHVPLARVADTKEVLYIPDLRTEPGYIAGEFAMAALAESGTRSLIAVPMLKEGELIGAIVIYRREVRPFSDKQIELVTSFANQAVIAIENVRLLNELRERQAELRVTFDNMGDGVVMFDTESRLTAWNRNFQEMLDLPDTFLAGRPSYTEYFHYLAERGEYSSDLEVQLSRTIEDTRREMRFERTRPDGRVIEVRRNPVPDGGFVLIYADITERKRAEAAISAARDAAEAALRELQTAQASLLHAQKMAALGQLTAGIAHEIKNPLNFVNNFAGLSVELLDELKEVSAMAMGALDTEKRAEFVETIEMLTGNLGKIAEHGRRADSIVRSMLQHSRGGSGDWQATDLNALVEEALNLAYHGARAQDQSFNITMERDFDQNIAPIEVVPQDMMRVFLNLIGNGFYAANKRRRETDGAFRPELKVTTRDLGEAVEIRVRDNGAGIPAEHREKLFQPFFTTKPTGEGTGLGLSISFEIVSQQHGGTITVDSEVGEFTEFTVRLPRRRHSATGRVA